MSLEVTPTSNDSPFSRQSFLLGIVGLAIGATVGYFAFRLGLNQGIYALAVIGALTGLGGSLGSRKPSVIIGLLCLLVALPLTLVADWQTEAGDPTFLEFISRIHLSVMRLIMIVLGVGMAYWIGRGR